MHPNSECADMGLYAKCGMLQLIECCKEQWSLQLVIVAGKVALTLRA